MNNEKLTALAEELFAEISTWEFPTDKYLNIYYRRHHYIGSKERRFITEYIYGKIRAMGLCPDWLRPYLPENFDAELEAYAKEAPTDLRVNTLKTSRTKVLREFPEADPTTLSPYGIRLRKRQALKMDGDYEVQDEGSQLVTIYADAKPMTRVLDYCAGAGGKALMLAMLMKNEGEITVYDPDESKIKSLKNRVERAQAKIIKTRKPVGGYDLVIVDAPCSGTGTWRRGPDAKWRLTEDKLNGYINLQSQILYEAAPHVGKGGRLVYITCSFLEDENERQAEKFLKDNPDFKVDRESLRLSPLHNNTDGFFAASFVRA